MFLATKSLEGRSENTLFLYCFNIGKLLEKAEKNVCVMNTDDVRSYCQGNKPVILCTFYTYLRQIHNEI